MFDKFNKFSIKGTTFCNMDCLYCHQLSKDKDYPVLFDKFELLEDFLMKVNFDDRVIVTITGGEITTRPDIFFKIVKVLNNVSKKRDIDFLPAITTNGSNMIKVFEWIKKRIIFPAQVNLSWDGYESFSKIRKGKTVIYNDKFFNDNLVKISERGYGELINVSYALTPYNINNFFDDFQFAINCGVRNFSYYLIHEGNYNNKDFIDRFREQIFDINNYLFENFYSLMEPINFYNHKVLYTRNMIGHDESEFKNLISCGKLGSSFHIDTLGDIYPCIYFGDHRTFHIGNLDDGGFYQDRVSEFINECILSKYNCDGTCKNNHCFECPACNYVSNGSINFHSKHACEIYSAERELFNIILKTLNKLGINVNRLFYIDERMTIRRSDNNNIGGPLAINKNNYKLDKCIQSDHLEDVKKW